jgi:hypothetical protein
MKNRFEDTTYKQAFIEGTRIVVQDIDIIDPPTGLTWANWASAYANPEDRGLNGGMLVVINKDMIRGNFEMHGAGGVIQKDESVEMGNGWSYKFNPNNAGVDLRVSQMIHVKSGVPVKVTAYMRKNAASNGIHLPGIIVKGQYQERIYQEMESVNDRWVRVELLFTPARNEMVEIGVSGRGTAGNFWIDPRISVTTHDLDFVNGPASINLMFGLEQYSQSAPGVILGGGMTL